MLEEKVRENRIKLKKIIQMIDETVAPEVQEEVLEETEETTSEPVA